MLHVENMGPTCPLQGSIVLVKSCVAVILSVSGIVENGLQMLILTEDEPSRHSRFKVKVTMDRPGTGLVDVMDQNIEGIVIKLGMNSARDARLNFIDVPCQRLSSQ